MSTSSIRLQIPFGPSPLVLTFNAEAEHDVRVLLRFARARAAHKMAGFWLEYGFSDGDSQMVWIDPAHMPMATFRVSDSPTLRPAREDRMGKRLATTDHLYFTADGWQSDTHEFAVEN